jgi:hypothetical protein
VLAHSRGLTARDYWRGSELASLGRALAYVVVGQHWLACEFVRDYNPRNTTVMRRVRIDRRIVLLPTSLRELTAIATTVLESAHA